jgi:hypothetical protein
MVVQTLDLLSLGFRHGQGWQQHPARMAMMAMRIRSSMRVKADWDAGGLTRTAAPKKIPDLDSVFIC